MLVLLYGFNPSFSPGDKIINGYALMGGYTFDADIYYLLNHAQDIKTEAMDSAAYRSAFRSQLYRPAFRNKHDEKPAVYLWANELTKIYCKASADVASGTGTDRTSQWLSIPESKGNTPNKCKINEHPVRKFNSFQVKTDEKAH